MEGARVGRARQEGLAPEDQREHLEPVAALRFGEGEQAVVVAGKIEERREIDLEELLGDRSRALVVEPPPRAVGENAPAERCPWLHRRSAAGSAASGSTAPSPRHAARSGGRAGAASAWTPPLQGRARSAAIPRRSRWLGPSPLHPRTAIRPARPPGRMRSGFAAAGSPSTRAVRGRARSDHPRSGFRWAILPIGKRSKIARSAASSVHRRADSTPIGALMC